MNYYNEIKTNLINNEVTKKVKDYGENIIEEYSKKLVLEVGKKYNKRTLYRMKQFYIIFSNEKMSPVVTQLS